MGVKDLWKLLEPAGRPVKLELLEGLVVGVDVSIWLNQAVKGMRDRCGEPVPHAHLIVLFNRICKLLHYHIKPVFVFDGATPQLKQLTLASRSKRRDIASQRSLRAADRQASKLLQAKILEHLTGEKSSVKVKAPGLGQSDMFHLPPIPEGALSKEKSPTFEDPFASVRSTNNMYLNDVASVNVHSEEFDSLPPEVQHEILLERQQIEKYSYHDPDTLPQVADDFSNYQLSRLMKRSQISQKLAGVRRVLKSNDTAVIGLGEESKVHDVETSRIMSHEAAHYILVKGVDIENQSSQDEDETDTCSQTSSMETYQHAAGRDCETDHSAFQDEKCGTERTLGRDGAPMSSLTTIVEKFPTAITRVERNIDEFGLESSGEENEKLRPKRDSRSNDEIILVVDEIDEQETRDDIAEVKTNQDRETQAHITDLMGKSNSSIANSLGTFSKDTLANQRVSTDKTTTTTRVVTQGPLFVRTAEEAVLTQEPSSSEVARIGMSDSSIPLDTESQQQQHPIGNKMSSTQTTNSETPSLEDDVIQKVSRKELPHCDATSSKEGEGSESSITAMVDLTTDSSHSAREQPALPPPTHSDFKLKDVAKVSEINVHSIPTPLTPEEQLEPSSLSTPSVAKKNSEIDLFPTHIPATTTQEVALIESDEGDSPSPMATTGPGLSCGEENVEALLSVAPSEAQEQLGREVEELERERTQQNRAAASVSNQMYKEAQELLSLFGLPYLVAPSEAEAQCAALNLQELTQATITDDNDIFLFGGKKVYRHFFSQTREVEVYTSEELQQRLGLSRDHLIVLAYLLGSDYTEGLEGIGIVMAMEFLRDFPGSGLEPLIKLRDWHSEVAHKPAIVKKGSALQKKLCQYPLPDGFPRAAVRQSYLHPEVDDSSEEFEWGKPDLDLIRRFAREKMGWNQEKVDEILLPVLKRVNARESRTQKKITEFLPTIGPTSPPPPSCRQKRTIKSRRIRNVVARLTAEDKEEYLPKKRPNKRNAKQRGPAAKRQKRPAPSDDSNHIKTTQKSPPSQDDQPLSRGPNLSASSSSSSEDEFDSLLKDLNEDEVLNTISEERTLTRRQKRATKRK